MASATWASRLLFGEAPSRNRLRFSAAAVASKAVPSVNFTSVRSFMVSDVLASLYFHSVASHGTSVPSGLARNRPSKTAWP